MNVYHGKKGKKIITAIDLQNAVKNCKSICFMSGDNIVKVTPASFVVNGNYNVVISSLMSGNMYIYEKPISQLRNKRISSKRKTGKTEGIKRILQGIYETDIEHERFTLMWVLRGMDPSFATQVQDNKFNGFPDVNKCKKLLAELDEAK